MSAPISDDQLLAFMQGQLDEAGMAAVEAAINADPDLADRAEALASQADASTDEAIRDAFAPILTAEVPAQMRDTVEAEPAGAQVIDFAAARSRRTMTGWGMPQLTAMAASLVLGLFGGYALLQAPDAGSAEGFALASMDGVRLGGKVGKVLSGTPSGQSVTVPGQGEVRVAITFKASDNRICRQFTLQSANEIDDALACRDGSGWHLEAFGRRKAPTGEMRTASGEAAAAVIVAVDELIAGDPLVGPAEASALR